MAGSLSLLHLGTPAAVAKKLGAEPTALTGTGTAQVGATALSVGQFGILTAPGGSTAFVLPADAANGDTIPVYVTSGTALIFPHSGANINGGSTDASISLAVNKTAYLVKLSTTLWTSGLTV
jgi:hypothetical protein